MRSVISSHKAPPEQTMVTMEACFKECLRGGSSEKTGSTLSLESDTHAAHPLYFSPYFSGFHFSGSPFVRVCPMRPRCGCGTFCWYDLE